MLDVVSAVGGRVVQGDLIEQVFGSRQVRFKDDISGIQDLQKLAGELLASYGLNNYKNQFAWVDHYTLVDDEVMIDMLRGALTEQLHSDASTVDVLLPDDEIEADGESNIEYILLPHEQIPGLPAWRDSRVVARPHGAGKIVVSTSCG
jgi:uncharacterized protein (TIGR04141 family)